MVFSACLSRFLSFLSAVLSSPSVSSFSLLLLPLFCRTSLTRSRWLQRFAPQPVLPAPWRPTSTRTSTSLRASCLARSLLAGPRLLPFGGALPKRRGNAGSDSELPQHQNTFIQVRWVCVFAYSLSFSLPLTLTLSLFHTLTLRNLSDSPSTQPHARFLPSLFSHGSSPFLLPPLLRLRLRLLFLFVLSSSSLSFLLPLRNSFLLFFTSASSSRCLSSWSSSSPLFPPRLTHAGSSSR